MESAGRRREASIHQACDDRSEPRQSKSEASDRLRARTWTAAIVLYSGVALLVTYPLVTALGKYLPGTSGDNGLYLWCADTFWTELGAGHMPFFTYRAFYPLGINLAVSACNPLLAVLAWPFLSNLILFGGVVSLATPVIAAVGMMLLVHALAADRLAAVMSGLLYGFCPALLSFLNAGHFPEAFASALIPYGLVLLIRFMRTGAGGWLLALSVVSWAILFTHVYQAVALYVMMVVMSACLAIRYVRLSHLAWGAFLVLGNAVLFAAYANWITPAGGLSDYESGGYAFTSTAVANLADLFVPSFKNPFLGFLYDRLATDRYNTDVDSYFLGWGVLLLALVGVMSKRSRPETVALVAAGLVVLVLSCGTAIRWGSTTLLTEADTPFEWFAQLPLADRLNAPRRLVVGTSVAVVALAGVGLGALHAVGRYRMVILLPLVLWALEYGQIGMPVQTIPVPEVYRRLAAAPGSRTVLEMGMGLAGSSGSFGLAWSPPSNHVAYWQTVHRKPRVGGYVSRIPRASFVWFATAPIMGELLYMADGSLQPWPGTTYPPDHVARFLSTFNLGYVIIPPSERQTAWAGVIESLLSEHIARTDRAEGYVLYTFSE